jgi:hypothetical protein
LQTIVTMPLGLAKYSTFAALVAAALSVVPAAADNPLETMSGDVVITPADRARLDAGGTVVTVAAGRDGFLSLTAVIRVNATPERLLSWLTAVETLQKGRYIPEIGRFSPVPRVDDLRPLMVDAGDLDDLAGCEPRDCGVKASAGEMAAFKGLRGRARLDLAFRRLLVRRAADYLAHGDAAQAPYDDRRLPVVPAVLFNQLLHRVDFLPRYLGSYADFLRGFPRVADPHLTHSFLYWSKETLGMKPIVSITHFSAARFNSPALPEVVSVAKQVYASHYRNASITVTALFAHGGARYLMYLNRSHVDAFQGVFGGLIRRTVERRVKGEAPGVLQGLRGRLESGDPPSSGGTRVAR